MFSPRGMAKGFTIDVIDCVALAVLLSQRRQSAVAAGWERWPWEEDNATMNARVLGHGIALRLHKNRAINADKVSLTPSAPTAPWLTR